uniref:Secreted protein n=1 Tax=Mesocestoides corti TaxID=53468 RepID=A0A5K3FYI9_MESCO
MIIFFLLIIAANGTAIPAWLTSSIHRQDRKGVLGQETPMTRLQQPT